MHSGEPFGLPPLPDEIKEQEGKHDMATKPKETPGTPQHETITAALVAAQMNMGKAVKSSENPHFRSKYADLSSVMDACMPHLNAEGIAVIQPTGEDEKGRFVETVMLHSDSGETLKCRIPLIVNKNDMQGFGSAVTYARRYGLMCMAGIAPDDDDGNGASKSPPPPTVTAEQFVALRNKIDETGAIEDDFLKYFRAASLQQFPADKFSAAMDMLAKKAKKAKKAEHKPEPERDPKDDLGGDEIPY